MSYPYIRRGKNQKVLIVHDQPFTAMQGILFGMDTGDEITLMMFERPTLVKIRVFSYN